MSMMGNVLILFGATGDLTIKKILPALDQWYQEETPYDSILCLGRRSFDKDSYLEYMTSKGVPHLSEDLRNRISYLMLEFNTAEDYGMLARQIQGGSTPRKITCYLAVKPDAFVTITANLNRIGLFEKGNPDHRLIFEKPFGESLETAREIQASILNLAEEKQVYRIDHYLGKDMIRNILTLRFGNRLFEESWNGRVLSTVRIISTETAGVEERLDYYDRAGAINDMIQSHLLQVVALVAMDAPLNFEAESIRQRKIEILSRIRLGKHEPITVGQHAGYRSLLPALAASKTETYVRAVLTLDLPEWEQTRFILETGKKMSEKRTEIILEFEPKPLDITRDERLKVAPNQLVIQVYPTEGVHLRFNSKVPGYDFHMESVDADYCHSCRITGNKPEAYVKLLRDVQAGDKTLFAGCDELELQWRIADQIQAAADKTDLWIYPPGIPIKALEYSEPEDPC